MPLSALALILFAALCHALWNFVLKRSKGGIGLITLTQITGTLLYIPVAWWSIEFNPANSNFSFAALHLLMMLGSGAIHTAYFLLLDRAYRSGGDLSLVYPVARATGPMLTVLVALTLMGETVKPLGIIGAITIIIAAFFFAGNPFKSSSKIAEQDRSALILALLTGCFICSYTLWDRYAVAALAMPAVLFYVGSVASRLFVLLPLSLLRDREGFITAWRKHKRSVLLIGVLSPLSYILVLLAMKSAPISLVAPLREVSILFAAALGCRLLGERITPQRIACAVAMFVGVALIAMR